MNAGARQGFPDARSYWAAYGIAEELALSAAAEIERPVLVADVAYGEHGTMACMSVGGTVIVPAIELDRGPREALAQFLAAVRAQLGIRVRVRVDHLVRIVGLAEPHAELNGQIARVVEVAPDGVKVVLRRRDRWVTCRLLERNLEPISGPVLVPPVV